MTKAHYVQTHFGWDDEETAVSRLGGYEKEAEDGGWVVRYSAVIYDRLEKLWGHVIALEKPHTWG